MIPQELRDQNAMLCEPHKKVFGNVSVTEAVELAAADGRYLADLKFDGVRCLAYIDDGVVTLVNRNHVDITRRYPDVVSRLATLFPTGQRVFDGEMLVFGEDGRPSFFGISKRDHDMSPAKTQQYVAQFPATLVIFDLLYFNGDDLRNTPYRARSVLLRTAGWPNAQADPHVQLTECSSDIAMMWQFVAEHGLEGLVIKLDDSGYDGRRSTAWVKLKPTLMLSAVITRYEFGKAGGHREHRIGALFLDLYDEAGVPVEVGKVGTGLNDADLADLKRRLDAGETLVGDVEYQEYTVAGSLRFTSWRGLRTDLKPEECTVAQLDAHES